MSPQSEEERKEMEKVPYASAVGSLMFLTVATRPDISFAVMQVAKFMHNPGKRHWTAEKNISLSKRDKGAWNRV